MNFWGSNFMTILISWHHLRNTIWSSHWWHSPWLKGLAYIFPKWLHWWWIWSLLCVGNLGSFCIPTGSESFDNYSLATATLFQMFPHQVVTSTSSGIWELLFGYCRKYITSKRAWPNGSIIHHVNKQKRGEGNMQKP